MNQTEPSAQKSLQALFDEYPLLLRWSELVELFGRLGLGSEWVVRKAVNDGSVQRRIVAGRRYHYTRASVEKLIL
jgi:hypothetical protein